MSFIPSVGHVLDSRLVTKRNHFRSALRFVAPVFLSLMGAFYSGSQETSYVALPATEIRALADRVLQEANKADCKPGNCRILVADFVFPTGATSQLGMQIADEFSKELASQQSAIQIIERSRLRAYLEQQSIPSTLLNNEKAMRWLGKQLGATAVLVGTTEDEGDSVRVQVNLRSCEKEKAGPVEGFTFPYAGSKDPFTALDFPAKAASVDNSSTDPAVFRARAGVGGVTSPICLYCPQPSYTNPARAAKFQGTMLLDVIVSPDGEMKSASFIRGLPFGLNDKAVEALRRWKFRPATLNAQPVMVKVQIEVTFRLY